MPCESNRTDISLRAFDTSAQAIPPHDHESPSASPPVTAASDQTSPINEISSNELEENPMNEYLRIHTTNNSVPRPSESILEREMLGDITTQLSERARPSASDTVLSDLSCIAPGRGQETVSDAVPGKMPDETHAIKSPFERTRFGEDFVECIEDDMVDNNLPRHVEGISNQDSIHVHEDTWTNKGGGVRQPEGSVLDMESKEKPVCTSLSTQDPMTFKLTSAVTTDTKHTESATDILTTAQPCSAGSLTRNLSENQMSGDEIISDDASDNRCLPVRNISVSPSANAEESPHIPTSTPSMEANRSQTDRGEDGSNFNGTDIDTGVEDMTTAFASLSLEDPV